MKMNRTEWLVVILCAAGLGWYMSRPAPPKPKRWTPPGPLFDLSILSFALALGIAHLVV